MGILKKERIWFILIEGKKEGPYSISQLRAHCKLTPDTLVWRKGFSKWIPISQVKELREVFRDDAKKKFEDKKKCFKPSHVLAKTTHHFNPAPFFWWLALLSIVLSYILYKYWMLS